MLPVVNCGQRKQDDMAYSDFKLEQLIKEFDLTLQEGSGLFLSVPEIQCSDYLAYTLKENVDLAIAINTEKARSELIIAPVLLEVRRLTNYEISLFSGVEFSIEPDKGLTGVCDFLMSKNSEQLLIRVPVLTVVEAKNENLKAGLAQCIAEMIAAQIFNQREGNAVSAVYGVVTIGTIWRFLRLSGKQVEVDLSEYYIQNINQILGILFHSTMP